MIGHTRRLAKRPITVQGNAIAATSALGSGTDTAAADAATITPMIKQAAVGRMVGSDGLSREANSGHREVTVERFMAQFRWC
jgi:hypothetical protein